ncbi:MAG: GntR family transcriptional regulator [Spirochaetes bacterium]|nr:GntR family transcriptional regulator [Spirochaetota bacterium]
MYSNELKYVKIYKWLKDQIETEKIKVGERLPTEESIAASFGINRMTVRQALDQFAVKKMIIRKRGYGTILVRKTPQDYIWHFNNISSFTESMEKSGIEAYTKSEKMEVIEADARVRKFLNLSDDLRVIYSLRVKYAENEPVCIEKSFLPYEKFKKLLNTAIKGSLYRVLIETFNTHLVKSTQYLSSVLSGDQEMELFSLNKHIPCLLVESLSYDSNNIPVEVLYSCFRGDRYKFKIDSGEYIPKK